MIALDAGRPVRPAGRTPRASLLAVGEETLRGGLALRRREARRTAV